MQRKILSVTQLLLFVFFQTAIAPMSTAEAIKNNIDIGPEEIVLKSPSRIRSARFPHRRHQEKFTCGQCHHAKNEAGVKIPYKEGMLVRKCIVCHNREAMISPKLNTFKLIAHSLCKECHKRQKNSSAPTRCSGCHIK